MGSNDVGLPTQDMPCSSTTSPVLAFTKVSSTSFSGGGVPAGASSQAHGWHSSTSQTHMMQRIARAPRAGHTVLTQDSAQEGHVISYSL